MIIRTCYIFIDMWYFRCVKENKNMLPFINIVQSWSLQHHRIRNSAFWKMWCVKLIFLLISFLHRKSTTAPIFFFFFLIKSRNLYNLYYKVIKMCSLKCNYHHFCNKSGKCKQIYNFLQINCTRWFYSGTKIVIL